MGELPANLLFPLFVTGQLSSVLLGRAIKASKLTPNEFAVLSIIAVFEPIVPTELAQRAGMPATTLSDYIARFTARRLVKRAPNPDDGRSYLLSLTADGRRRNSSALEGLRSFESRDLGAPRRRAVDGTGCSRRARTGSQAGR